MVGGAYGLAALFAASLQALLLWAVLGLIGVALATVGDRVLARTGSFSAAALLILAPGWVLEAMAVVFLPFARQPPIPFVICGCHAVACFLAVQRALRPGGLRSGDAVLANLERQTRRIALTAYGVWIILLGLQVSRPEDFVLAAWLGLALAWWLIEEEFEGPRALVRRIQMIFSRYASTPDQRRRAQVLRRALLENPRDIPPEVPALIGELMPELPEAAKMQAVQVLVVIRRSLRRVAGRDRSALGECLAAARRGGELEALMKEAAQTRLVERLLLLRGLYLAPPREDEAPGAEAWLVRETWSILGGLQAGSRAATAAQSILHDAIKHGLPRLDGPQERARTLAAGESLPQADREVVNVFLDDLLDRLRGIDSILGPGLLNEEVHEADALRRSATWGRTEHLALDELVARTRRLLERFLREVRVMVTEVAEQCVTELRAIENGAAEVDIEVLYDPERCSSLTLVAERQLVRTLVSNLLNNAVTAARQTLPPAKGKVIVRVGLTGDPREPMIELRIEDSGPGLPQVMPQQSPSGTSRGLGLVREAVATLQGELVWGQSSLGGASVSARLPRSVSARPAEAARGTT